MGAVTLECWGRGWKWDDCYGVGVSDSNLGNISLVPLPDQQIELTWTANHPYLPRKVANTLPGPKAEAHPTPAKLAASSNASSSSHSSKHDSRKRTANHNNMTTTDSAQLNEQS